jgi:hypothetical protein
MAAVWLTGACHLFAAPAHMGPFTDRCPSGSQRAGRTKPSAESDKPLPPSAATGIDRNSRRVLILRMSSGTLFGVLVHRDRPYLHLEDGTFSISDA